jgi:UDP-2,4-diacetamido-2,4,6-trideoxy-beta-L-altropyranose hydrolase
MKLMKIAIRADGGSFVGMGHIMRTLVLAKELSKNNEVFYICRVSDSNNEKFQAGINKIEANGFEVKAIREGNVIGDIEKIYADCLITDSYDVSEKYFDLTKDIFKCTGYIDDENLYYFNVDFIINQNVNALEFKYRANFDTKLFLGTEYVLLREEFQNAVPKAINSHLTDIFVTVGGGDPNNITKSILNKVKGLPFTFHVIIGPSFSDIDNIKSIANMHKNIILYYNANMYAVMQKCDLAISACGSTIYELCACGIPTIGLVIADNQESIAEYLGEHEIINNLGWYNGENFDKLHERIVCLADDYYSRVKMAKKQIKMINKNGAKALSSKINEFL